MSAQPQSIASPRAFRLPWRAQFALLALIWGASFMFIKVGDEALSPLQVAFARIACGAAVLVPILRLTGDRLPPRGRIWLHLAVVAVLFNVAPFSLFAFGETRVSSIVAGIWNATTPLATLLFLLIALPEERPTRARTAGLGLGFLGSLVVLGPWSGLGGHALAGNLACLAASACYGLAFVYTRKNLSDSAHSVVSLSAAQLLCATVEIGVIVPFATAAPHSLPAKVVLSMLALGALGTGFAYILNYSVIRAAGPAVASSVTYLIPVFAAVFGIALLGERLSWNEPVGAAIVVVGVAIAQRGGFASAVRRRRRRSG